MIQLNFDGASFKPAGFLSYKKQFAMNHCVHLPKFLSEDVLRKVSQCIQAGIFTGRSYGREVGEELCMAENEGWNLLHFLMNDPQMFRAVKEITGAFQIGFFSGRIYQINPERDHFLAWHNDLKYNRALGFSLNLSGASYQGGRLQIRSAKTRSILYEAAVSKPGDALLFRIDSALEHRITAVTGRRPRIAYAGWFYPKPETAWFKRKKMQRNYANR